jgi:hypothetical protein
VGPAQSHLLEGFQGQADDLRRRWQANAPPDQAHLQLQSRCLHELVQGGLEPGRQFLEILVLDQVAAAPGNLLLLPGQQLFGGVLRAVPVDRMVVDTALRRPSDYADLRAGVAGGGLVSGGKVGIIRSC